MMTMNITVERDEFDRTSESRNWKRIDLIYVLVNWCYVGYYFLLHSNLRNASSSKRSLKVLSINAYLIQCDALTDIYYCISVILVFIVKVGHALKY